MSSFLRESGADWLGVVVDRSDVEKGDIMPTLDVLRSAMADADTCRIFQGQVEMSFDGYNEDPREIYEVPEIREFLRALDSQFPYWFYFLSTESDTLRMVTFCLCSTRQLGPGLVHVQPGELQTFILSHFTAMNSLFNRFCLDERINEEVTQCVLEYFAGSSRP
jgi:hypothetical protein